MRIHRLEIQAFGPFAGREIIDFDQLGAQGLFLLNGSTGAGKTSILDSIAYALYGTVPGARSNSANQLRSHHAAQGVGPEVLCEFTAGGRRLEVRRSPEWMRPVKRGSGTTREQASTQLREKNADGWEVKSTRNDEAASEIQQLLGMNMAQFTKVVLLAQGEFAAFLRATAADRQALLQRLFGTDVYEGVENRLAAESRTAQGAVATGMAELLAKEELARSQSRSVLAAYAAQLAQAEEGGQAPETAEPVELHGMELFASLGEQLERALTLAQAHAQTSQEESEALVTSIAEEQNRRTRHQQLVEAVAEQERLAGLADEEAQWRHSLELHHQGQVLAAVVTAAAKSARESTQAQEAAARAATVFDSNPVAAALLGQPGATASIEDLQTLDKELIRQLAAVDRALPDETRNAGKSAALAKNEKALADALTQRQQQDAAATAARARLTEVQDRAETLRAGAVDVEHAEQAATAAKTLVGAIEEYQAHCVELVQLEDAEREARDKSLNCRQSWLEAIESRLSQAAGELAATLVEGEPCQVCGSTVHPAPSPLAAAGADLLKAERAAKKLSDTAEAAAKDAGTRLAQARSALAVLAERGGEGELAKAQDAVVQRRQAHQEAKAGAAERDALHQEAGELQERLEQAREGVVAAAGQAASLSAAQAALAEEIADLGQQLELAQDGYTSLAQRRVAVLAAQQPGEELLVALRKKAAAMTTAQDAGAALEKDLEGSVFADASGVQAALLAPGTAAALDEKIKDHAKAVAVNTDRLATAQMLAARAETVVVLGDNELAALAQQSRVAVQLAKTAELAAGMARSAATEVRLTQADFMALEEDVAPLREKAKMLLGLAEAVRGQGENKYKMTLSSYVLTARLEQVAQAASVRLATMSDARYTLRHSDAKKGNQKSGLGLEVVDEWTGISRDTATLSGGESFMASLSLALGLSDVVQYESGGLDIETLFVDEGFGSLDEQSLEQVMDALEGLRDGGRMVGLVSHVAEMKQRIPVHLHVHKGRHGSTVELKMAGAQAS
ncbi:exonuclease SbcC [Arthrobacter sp. UYCu511]|uniref:SMC family ATPase n=1 Tax=Arthrobacter sp. UYCu511 TaxID=3156337 RepID=UPI00339481D9